MDANALIQSVEAINTLRAAGVMSKSAAKRTTSTLIQKLGECMSYWSDKEQWDIVDALNAAHRKAAAQ